MSLDFLKIHYRNADPPAYPIPGGRMLYPRRVQVACGRWSPDWARKTTRDPDFVTCESCLSVLVAGAVAEIRERNMSTEEILERHA